MWLYVLGPVAALIVATVVYVIERGPIIGSRWIDFLLKWDNYRATPPKAPLERLPVRRMSRNNAGRFPAEEGTE